MQFFSRNLLWSQGVSLLIILVVAAIVSYVFYRPALLLVGAAFVFCLFFFRNPIRVCPQAFNDPSIIICPADGKVLEVQSIDPVKFDGYSTKIAIFLSPLDVHVNWLPVGGTVADVAYHKGKFYPAFLPKSSELNERNDVLLKTQNGSMIKVRQITGTIARVIVCWVSKGQSVQAGDTFGMMKFGSRIDLFLPKNTSVALKEGDRVYGGQTVLGRWI
jgi:phosphatidylserine decarboxylase